MAVKNPCGKAIAISRAKTDAYEVWQAGEWTWYVLKKYQNPTQEAKNPYARWFCFVTSPLCPRGEAGDVYAAEVKRSAHLVVSRIPA